MSSHVGIHYAIRSPSSLIPPLSWSGLGVTSLWPYSPSVCRPFLRCSCFTVLTLYSIFPVFSVIECMNLLEIIFQLTLRDVTPGLSSLWWIRCPPTTWWIMAHGLRVICAVDCATHFAPPLLFWDGSPQGPTDRKWLASTLIGCTGHGRVQECCSEHSSPSVQEQYMFVYVCRTGVSL